MQMMRDTAIQDHLTIAELLPDFVLGTLDETSLRRVSRHLEACQTCRNEYGAAMEALGTLAATPPPPAFLRGAVLRRAAALPPVLDQPVHARHALPRQGVQAPQGIRLLTDVEPQHAPPFGRPLPRWTLAVASLLVFLVAGLAGVGFTQRNMAMPAATSADQRIQALISDPAAAFPLDDSDLATTATGVVFAEPNGRDVYLVANGLPPLPQDQHYQVWLFSTDDQTVSAGQVALQADGEVRALLQTPDPFIDYVGVALTAEPQTGSPDPTSDMVLGGSFPPLSASLPADTIG
jgi:anti-sigma factor RsiW